MVSSLFRLGSVVNIHSSGSLTLPSLIKSLFAFLLSLVALVFADFEKIHPTTCFIVVISRLPPPIPENWLHWLTTILRTTTSFSITHNHVIPFAEVSSR